MFNLCSDKYLTFVFLITFFSSVIKVGSFFKKKISSKMILTGFIVLLFVCLSLSCEHVNLCNCERERNSRWSCMQTTCSCITIATSMIASSTKDVDIYVSSGVRKINVLGHMRVHIHAETQEQLSSMCNIGIVDVAWSGKIIDLR